METCYGEEKSGFPVQPEEKIRKNRVFEVHIEKALITHLITVLFTTFGVCCKNLAGFIQIKVHGRAILEKAV